jgi:Zn-dependent peptidase ImmA (M78 family)
MARSCNSELPPPRDLASRILASARQKRPPVDVEAVIKLWPELRLSEDDLDGEGYLLGMGQLGAEIIVRSSAPTSRKRFTVAHELGHWVLQRHSRLPLECTGHADRERWCDSFAAELLMPASWVRSQFGHRVDESFAERLSLGHRAYSVSSEALRNRVSELYSLDVCHYRSAPGGPPALSFALSKSTVGLARTIVGHPEVTNLLQKSRSFCTSIEVARLSAFVAAARVRRVAQEVEAIIVWSLKSGAK